MITANETTPTTWTTDMPDDCYLTTSEAAALIPPSGQHVKTIERACRAGRIKARRIGRKWAIPATSLQAYIGLDRPEFDPSELPDIVAEMRQAIQRAETNRRSLSRTARAQLAAAAEAVADLDDAAGWLATYETQARHATDPTKYRSQTEAAKLRLADAHSAALTAVQELEGNP